MIESLGFLPDSLNAFVYIMLDHARETLSWDLSPASKVYRTRELLPPLRHILAATFTLQKHHRANGVIYS